MEWNIPEDLRDYVQGQVLPLYQRSDSAHGPEHIRQVLANSWELAQGAFFGRQDHHLTSARLLREDGALSQWFTPEERETMAQAVEDHRASVDREPRSLYGKIVSEADRDIDPERIVRRVMEYGKARFPEKDTSWQVRRAVEHIREKYGEGGYLKLWLHSPRNQAGLDKLRQWLATGELEEVCKRYG